MIFPKIYKEVLNLINKIPEDIHLEYKSGMAIDFSKVVEMSKDVSAFANSDGGVLIYGVQEDKLTHLPVSIDGVDSKKYSHEWLENVIKSNITPIIPDLEIKPIKIKGSNLVIYSIFVPKSYRAPHQAKDKKYYKRYNFKSEAMENYEIDDIRSRLQTIPSLVNISAKVESMMAFLIIENIGEYIAKEVAFELSDDLKNWAVKQEAKVFSTGVKYFPPQQKYKFRYGFINSIFHEGSQIPSQFEIAVSYQHPLYQNRIQDTFGIDLQSYFGSSVDKSDASIQGEKIEQSIKELTEQVKKLNSILTEISNISGASGLALSIPTLKNFKNMLENKNFEKLSPIYQSHSFFMEILGVNMELAYHISDHFRQSDKSEGLKQIEGINDKTIENIKQFFILDSDGNEPT